MLGGKKGTVLGTLNTLREMYGGEGRCTGRGPRRSECGELFFRRREMYHPWNSNRRRVDGLRK